MAKEKVSDTQCFHSPNLLTADWGTFSAVTKLTWRVWWDSENPQRGGSNWGLGGGTRVREHSTCSGRVPAGSKARSAGCALEAEKAPSSGTRHPYRPRLEPHRACRPFCAWALQSQSALSLKA